MGRTGKATKNAVRRPRRVLPRTGFHIIEHCPAFPEKPGEEKNGVAGRTRSSQTNEAYLIVPDVGDKKREFGPAVCCLPGNGQKAFPETEGRIKAEAAIALHMRCAGYTSQEVANEVFRHTPARPNGQKRKTNRLWPQGAAGTIASSLYRNYMGIPTSTIRRSDIWLPFSMCLATAPWDQY